MSPSTKKTIILIDDEVDVASLVAESLQPEFDVIEFTDGAAAWKSLGAGLRPDLIISDVHVPGMNGYRLLRNLREHEELVKIPLILFSGDVLLEDIGELLAVDGWFSKSTDLEKLRALVRKILK